MVVLARLRENFIVGEPGIEPGFSDPQPEVMAIIRLPVSLLVYPKMPLRGRVAFSRFSGRV